MADYSQGSLSLIQAGNESRSDITVVIRNWFADRNPLLARLAHYPVGRTDFILNSHKYRARSTTLTNAISSNSTTGLVIGDASFLLNHDVLELVDSSTGNTERVQLSVDPTSGTGITVTRGVSGTTALSSVAAGSTIRLIGNSRTGGEVSQTGLSSLPGDTLTQYCQVFQFPFSVDGSAQANTLAVLPSGIQTPFDEMKAMQLQNMCDDIETSLVYGIGQQPSTSATPKMYGVRSILKTNNISAYANAQYSNQAAPTNKDAYSSSDFVRDTLLAARRGGGQPDIMLVSTDFMAGFVTWGQALQRLGEGATSMGVPISMYEAPFLNGVTIVEAPLLNTGTAIALTSSEVYVRTKRPPFLNEKAKIGDRFDGEWIADLALAIVNESHHAFVEGITNFVAN